MIALAVLLVVALQVLRNHTPPTGIDWGRLDLSTGLTPADATVVVLGLVTVAAALSIALAATLSLTGSLPQQEVPEFAARAVWAHYTSFVACACTTLSLATALTQFFNTGTHRKPSQATLLVLTALIGVVLAAAVTRWSGQESVREVMRVKEREHLEEVRRRWLPRSAGRRASTSAWAGALQLAFVVTALVLGLLAVQASVLPDPAIALHEAHTAAWWAVVLGLPPTTSILFSVMFLGHDTADLEVHRVERWLARWPVPAATFIYGSTVLLELTTSPSTTYFVQVLTLFLGSPLLTAWLLLRGRVRPHALGRFATEHALQQLDRRLAATGRPAALPIRA